MAFQRRRYNYYNRLLRRLLPLICAGSGALLILFALLSIFSPPPDDSDRRISKQINYEDNDEKNIAVVFRVPRGGGRSDRDIWRSWNAEFFYGCCNASSKFPNAKAITRNDRYLAIATSGGLNQQRTGIVDAVVAARILNATLVIPNLDQKSYWKDASDFSHIFDVDWFMSFLSKDVKIIEQLPKKGGKTWSPSRMRVPRKCNEKCYLNRVLPVLQKRHAVQLNKFDYRLSNKLRDDLQKLRFEPDMLAFSGCYYGGGEKEKKELGSIRRRWKTLHIHNPEKQRRQGRCPLTPEEVGLMLRALGYGSDVHIYVASGEVYGGEESLAPLKALFPHFYSKDTIATKMELEPFSSYSSRMAALDFLVCDESDVFVTNNNGNMARILAGRRRYFGHKPTIRPNAKKLYKLFLSKENTTWEEFASRVRTFQRGFMGEPKEVRAGRGEFHENPSTCICEDTDAKAKAGNVDSRKAGKKNKKDVVVTNDEHNEDEEAEWSSETDYEEDQTDLQDRGLYNGTRLDYEDASSVSDEPEIEEMLSD
ncbi:hypothetical protein AALP_AA1G223700 [Arabis alpina]|uniref:O-fucosyltransferase family protein n=1 Tax=Arabis alpina TaxID=50452 RepID=A0A087HPW8_ARAAL|nr:hypothetical protein AALP_AA1G223700 [Arabis alpina]